MKCNLNVLGQQWYLGRESSLSIHPVSVPLHTISNRRLVDLQPTHWGLPMAVEQVENVPLAMLLTR